MRELIKQYNARNFTVSFYVDGGENGSAWFGDLYTASEHIAGVTVQVPSQLQRRDSHKFYIRQTTPAELAKDYAKQGRENPSAEAYESLQRELGWYLTAADYSIVCVIEKAGVEITEVYGPGVDYSGEYADESLDEYVIKHGFMRDYASEVLKEAITEARSTLTALAA